MKNRLYLLFSIAIALILQGCSASDDTSIIAGQVVEAGSLNPINNAVVKVAQPPSIQQTATTDSAGNFSFNIDPVDESQSISLETIKEGYESTTTDFELTAESNVDDLFILLGSSDSNDDGDEEETDDGNVGGVSGGPAALVLKDLSSSTINVAETGGTVNTAFTFEVQDSAGRVVDSPTDVNFQIINGPNGGEGINPITATTGVNSSTGNVTSNLFSGDSSGTVRIEAIIERPEHNLTIRSTPVLISISSGFPVNKNFNVAPRVHNFDAYGIIDEDQTNGITASVGDLKGNPVKEGTAVYFSAPNGGLVNGSASTNANGYASVNLSANGSTPSGHPRGPGFIDIVAQTVDKDNNTIEKSTTLLLTTPKANITANPSTMSISNGGSQTFDITITDQNGYPMAANTNITISTGEGLTASGDIMDLELGDYFQPGAGTTQFSVTISDDNPDEDQSTDGSFTINVESPSGETTTKTINGSRAKR